MVRPVTITFVANGFKVDVGCQTFVFNAIDVLLLHVREYLSNPIEKEKQMIQTSRNMQFTNDGLLGTECATPTRHVADALGGCGSSPAGSDYGGSSPCVVEQAYAVSRRGR